MSSLLALYGLPSTSSSSHLFCSVVDVGGVPTKRGGGVPLEVLLELLDMVLLFFSFLLKKILIYNQIFVLLSDCFVIQY